MNTTKQPLTLSLVKQYILSGPLFYGNPHAGENGLFDNSLEIVSNRFFATEGLKKKWTLVATNSNGVLHPVDKNVAVGKHPIQRFHCEELLLNILPPGVIRYIYFTKTDTWKNELIEQMNKNIKDTFIKTIPIRFQQKHLKKPDDYATDDEIETYESFNNTDIYHGQLIPKIQGVFILISNKYFHRRAKIPTVCKKEDKTAEIGLTQLTLESGLTYKSSLSGEKTDANVRVFAFVSENPIEETKYIIEIKKSDVNDQLKEWCNTNGQLGIRFSFDVKFSISNLYGDFDFHLLDPFSLEEAVFTQFPHRYTHIQELLKEPDKDQQATYKKSAVSFKTLIDRAEWAKAKHDFITGFSDANYASRLVGIASDLAKFHLALKKDSATHKKYNDVVSQNIEAFSAILKAAAGWNDYQKVSASQPAVIKLMKNKELGLLKKLFHGIRFQDIIQNKIADATPGAPEGSIFKKAAHQFENFLFKKENVQAIECVGKSVDPKTAMLLYRDAVSKNVEKLGIAYGKYSRGTAKFFGETLPTLDIAISVGQIAQTAFEGHKLDITFDKMNGRLMETFKTYEKKFGNDPDPAAIKMIEGLRRMTDVTRLNIDINDKKLMAQSVDLMLSIMVFIPVVGEFAALLIFLSLAYDAMKSSFAAIASNLDAMLLDNTIKAIGDHFNRLNELEQEYEINIKCIRDMVEDDSDLEKAGPQFRIRSMVINGLLRLIDRCGTRFGNDEAFRRKVKQYNIEGYIKTFITDINLQDDFLLQTYVTLDEIWLFHHENNKYDSKTGIGTSTLDLIMELQKTRNTKISKFYKTADITDLAWVKHLYNFIDEMVGARKYKLQYQKQFPIHTMDSNDVFTLARNLSTDYSGISKRNKNLVFSAAYYWNGTDRKWHPITSSVKITPYTKVRVVVIFQGEKTVDSHGKETWEDLTGVPISIRLIRTDVFPDFYGPIYKGSLSRTRQSMDNGHDKGLIDEELDYLSGSKKSWYGFVLHPFYFILGDLRRGIKPCGNPRNLGNILSDEPTLDYFFNLKAGKLNQSIKINKQGQDEFSVTITRTVDKSLEGELNPDKKKEYREYWFKSKTFQNHNGTQDILDSVFPRYLIKDPKKHFNGPRLVGYLLKKGERWIFYEHMAVNPLIESHPYYKDRKHKMKSQRTMHAGKDFTFSWTDAFSMILLFRSNDIAEWRKKRSKIKFPIQMTTHLKHHFMLRKNGPSYETGVIWCNKDEFDKKKTSLSLSELTGVLSRNGIIAQNDTIEDSLHPERTDYTIDANYVFATALEFKYDVEDNDGKMQTHKMFKPFGIKHETEADNVSYTYELRFLADKVFNFDLQEKIQSETSAVYEKSVITLELPGLPKTIKDKHSFLNNELFYTDSNTMDSLSIRMSDFQKN